MNDNKVFVDTNVMELLCYPQLTKSDELRIKRFITDSVVTDINQDIKQNAINIRKRYKLKLFDAIIAATAFHLNLPLLTADNAFSKVNELSIIACQ